jgi:hypothetical protein
MVDGWLLRGNLRNVQTERWVRHDFITLISRLH